MSNTVPWWLRLLLIFATIQAMELGTTLFFAPGGSVSRNLFPLVVSPLNGRVIGAMYIGGAVGLMGSIFVRRAIDSRLMLIGLASITGYLMVMTIVYWDEFTVEHVPNVWIALYIADPILAAFTIWKLKMTRAAAPRLHQLSPAMLAEAILLGGVGLILVLAPGFSVEHWPWKITTLLARVYAAFFLGFGITALLAAREARLPAIRAFVLGSMTLGIFVVVASSRHLDRFRPGMPKLVWFTGFGVGAVVMAIALAFILAASPKSETA